MSEGKVELTVTKSRAVKVGEEYVRAEYTVKTVVSELNELDAARIALESKVDAWLSQLKPVAPAKTATFKAEAPQPQGITVEDVKNNFPEDLQGLLSFEEKGEYVIIKPRQFLGAENFARIADIIRKMNGEYISAGKESRFRIPKRCNP